MAAGDRNKSGRATDIVMHAQMGGTSDRVAMCGRKDPGYMTEDMKEITCKKCLQRRRIAIDRILDSAIF